MKEFSRREVLKAGLGIGALASLVAEGYRLEDALSHLRIEHGATDDQIDALEGEFWSTHLQDHQNLHAQTNNLNSRLSMLEGGQNDGNA